MKRDFHGWLAGSTGTAANKYPKGGEYFSIVDKSWNVLFMSTWGGFWNSFCFNIKNNINKRL